jgi:hypothetical protein
MPVVSDLLGSCGLRLLSEIFTDGSYSLYRVDYQGRRLVAEVSSAAGVFQHRWPSVGCLVSPLSARDLPGQQKLLLFDTGEGEFLCEKAAANDKLSIERAIDYTIEVLKIVTDLQAAGMICGYLGPEMFISTGTGVLMLAGRRGVPVSPFTPREIGSSRPSDPRSDVSAMGFLLFRLIAGSDRQEEQLRVWNALPAPVRTVIQDLIADDPINRPSGLRMVLSSLESLIVLKPEQPAVETTINETTFIRPVKKKTSRRSRKKVYRALGIAALLGLAYFAFESSGLSVSETSSEPVPADTVPVVPVEEVSPWAEDTTSGVPETSVLLEDTARVWISNCTGTAGLDFDFRAGPAREFSYVYLLTGTAIRQTSIILVTRADPSVPISSTALGQAARQMADTSFIVKPVDLTIMLGTDLSYPGINSQYFHQPVAPADTLFVGVVNHGIQYSLENMGAAAWTASRLEGKACDIAGVEWIISISDIRDADMFNEEIGVPELLEETLFIHKEGNLAAAGLETVIRQYLQALPPNSTFPVENIPVPDLHVLMGRQIQD